jgi:hypothetical protein
LKIFIVSAVAAIVWLTLQAAPVFAQSCIELGTCQVQVKEDSQGNAYFDVLTWLMFPLEQTFSVWLLVIVWGMIIFYIWIRTGSPLYAGFVGVIISSSLTASSTLLESLAPAMQMATILLACSFGLVLYAVFRRGASGQ